MYLQQLSDSETSSPFERRAMVLCFTEIELCFRDIYEKEKRKGSVITRMVHTGSSFLIQRRSLCLRGDVTV